MPFVKEHGVDAGTIIAEPAAIGTVMEHLGDKISDVHKGILRPILLRVAAAGAIDSDDDCEVGCKKKKRPSAVNKVR